MLVDAHAQLDEALEGSGELRLSEFVLESRSQSLIVHGLAE